MSLMILRGVAYPISDSRHSQWPPLPGAAIPRVRHCTHNAYATL